MTEAEQMAVYNLQVMGLKAEVAQRFVTIALMVVACVALVVAIIALCNYIMKCRAEIAAVKGEAQPEVVDTSYTTLNLDGMNDVQPEAVDDVQYSDDSAE